MRKIRGVLVGVLCIGVFAAPSAFASKGELLNKEGKALVKNKFTGTLGESKLESVEKASVTCKGGTITGVVTSVKAAEASIVLESCKSGLQSCQTGAKEGELDLPTTTLSVLPYIEASTTYGLKEVVVHCPKLELTVDVNGSFLVPIGASQEKTFKTEYKFTAKQTEGKQMPLEGENAEKETFRFSLEANFGMGFIRAGFAAPITIRYEELAEYV